MGDAGTARPDLDTGGQGRGRLRVGAVLLAAGLSRRFGPRNKLLEEVDGAPVVSRPAVALAASRAAPVVAVVGHEAAAVTAVLARAAPRIDVVENLDFARGMGNSLAAGVGRLVALSAAMGRPLDGALVVPGDLLRITVADVEAVLAAFEAAGGRAVVHAATADGGQCHPVVWPTRHLAALAALEGEAGGKALMDAERRRDPGAVVAVVLPDDRLADVDTPADLAARDGV